MSDGDAAMRILFVTLGGSPRSTLVSEIAAELSGPVDVTETGLLDGLGAVEIEGLGARSDEESLVAYIDDREVVLSRQKIVRRASELIAALPLKSYDLVVLMSTGIFREFEGTVTTVNGQRAVESVIISLAARGEQVGLVVPLQRQVNELDIPALSYFSVKITHARHQSDDELRQAAEQLADCDYIVLNSMGYDERKKRLVADLTRKPVLLPRQIILSSIRLFQSAAARHVASMPTGLAERLADLTPREKQVMALVCEGLSNKVIARQLAISPKTVEIHRSNILRKMQVPSSGALIRLVVGARVQ